jgi:hypothetical protein
MLKIIEILIKIILFKVNYSNLVSIKFNINHGLLFILVNIVVNLDLVVIKECQVLLLERSEFTKKLVINLLLLRNKHDSLVI